MTREEVREEIEHRLTVKYPDCIPQGLEDCPYPDGGSCVDCKII